jgi:hypothetical protein
MRKEKSRTCFNTVVLLDREYLSTPRSGIDGMNFTE